MAQGRGDTDLPRNSLSRRRAQGVWRVTEAGEGCGPTPRGIIVQPFALGTEVLDGLGGRAVEFGCY